MKTLKFSLLLAFLASPIFIFSNFRPQKDQTVQALIQSDAALNRLRVVVTKPSDVPVTLRVLDQDGWLLYDEPVSTGSTRVQAHLNLRAIPDGTYRVEVGDPKRVQAHLIHLSSKPHPLLKRQIDIWPAD